LAFYFHVLTTMHGQKHITFTEVSACRFFITAGLSRRKSASVGTSSDSCDQGNDVRDTMYLTMLFILHSLRDD